LGLIDSESVEAIVRVEILAVQELIVVNGLKCCCQYLLLLLVLIFILSTTNTYLMTIYGKEYKVSSSLLSIVIMNIKSKIRLFFYFDSRQKMSLLS